MSTFEQAHSSIEPVSVQDILSGAITAYQTAETSASTASRRIGALFDAWDLCQTAMDEGDVDVSGETISIGSIVFTPTLSDGSNPYVQNVKVSTASSSVEIPARQMFEFARFRSKWNHVKRTQVGVTLKIDTQSSLWTRDSAYLVVMMERTNPLNAHNWYMTSDDIPSYGEGSEASYTMQEGITLTNEIEYFPNSVIGSTSTEGRYTSRLRLKNQENVYETTSRSFAVIHPHSLRGSLPSDKRMIMVNVLEPNYETGLVETSSRERALQTGNVRVRMFVYVHGGGSRTIAASTELVHILGMSPPCMMYVHVPSKERQHITCSVVEAAASPSDSGLTEEAILYEDMAAMVPWIPIFLQSSCVLFFDKVTIETSTGFGGTISSQYNRTDQSYQCLFTSRKQDGIVQSSSYISGFGVRQRGTTTPYRTLRYVSAYVLNAPSRSMHTSTSVDDVHPSDASHDTSRSVPVVKMFRSYDSDHGSVLSSSLNDRVGMDATGFVAFGDEEPVFIQSVCAYEDESGQPVHANVCVSDEQMFSVGGYPTYGRTRMDEMEDRSALLRAQEIERGCEKPLLTDLWVVRVLRPFSVDLIVREDVDGRKRTSGFRVSRSSSFIIGSLDETVIVLSAKIASGESADQVLQWNPLEKNRVAFHMVATREPETDVSYVSRRITHGASYPKSYDIELRTTFDRFQVQSGVPMPPHLRRVFHSRLEESKTMTEMYRGDDELFDRYPSITIGFKGSRRGESIGIDESAGASSAILDITGICPPCAAVFVPGTWINYQHSVLYTERPDDHPLVVPLPWKVFHAMPFDQLIVPKDRVGFLFSGSNRSTAFVGGSTSGTTLPSTSGIIFTKNDGDMDVISVDMHISTNGKHVRVHSRGWIMTNGSAEPFHVVFETSNDRSMAPMFGVHVLQLPTVADDEGGVVSYRRAAFAFNDTYSATDGTFWMMRIPFRPGKSYMFDMGDVRVSQNVVVPHTWTTQVERSLGRTMFALHSEAWGTSTAIFSYGAEIRGALDVNSIERQVGIFQVFRVDAATNKMMAEQTLTIRKAGRTADWIHQQPFISCMLKPVVFAPSIEPTSSSIRFLRSYNNCANVPEYALPLRFSRPVDEDEEPAPDVQTVAVAGVTRTATSSTQVYPPPLRAVGQQTLVRSYSDAFRSFDRPSIPMIVAETVRRTKPRIF